MTILPDVPTGWESALRPHVLPYHVFGIERAFAFDWWLAFLALPALGVYALALQLGVRALTAALISLIVALSPFVQWWTGPWTATIGYGTLAGAAFLAAARARSPVFADRVGCSRGVARRVHRRRVLPFRVGCRRRCSSGRRSLPSSLLRFRRRIGAESGGFAWPSCSASLAPSAARSSSLSSSPIAMRSTRSSNSRVSGPPEKRRRDGRRRRPLRRTVRPDRVHPFCRRRHGQRHQPVRGVGEPVHHSRRHRRRPGDPRPEPAEAVAEPAVAAHGPRRLLAAPGLVLPAHPGRRGSDRPVRSGPPRPDAPDVRHGERAGPRLVLRGAAAPIRARAETPRLSPAPSPSRSRRCGRVAPHHRRRARGPLAGPLARRRQHGRHRARACAGSSSASGFSSPCSPSAR